MNGPLMRPPSTAMILAAGFGTRMGALTRDRPKPLLKVAGATLLDRAIDLCVAAGVRRVVINLHYRGEMIKAALSSRNDVEIAYSEETEILETGGGVARALPLLGAEPFFVVNSDAIWTGASPLDELAASWRPEMRALLNVASVDRAIEYTRDGDFFLSGGELTRRGDATSAPFVYTGAQIIRPDLFVDAPTGAFSLNLIWDEVLRRTALHGVRHDGDWIDVGAPPGLARAAELVG